MSAKRIKAYVYVVACKTCKSDVAQRNTEGAANFIKGNHLSVTMKRIYVKETIKGKNGEPVLADMPKNVFHDVSIISNEV